MTVRTYQDRTPQIGQQVFIDPTALVLGDVHIGDHSSIWPMVVVRGDMNVIRIGQKCSIQDGSILHITHAYHDHPNGYPLTLGDEVTVGHQAILHGCTIHNRVLIGMGATVMDGAVIEEEVVLGAGSLVPPNKRLASGFLYLGSPAKQIRPLTEKELAYFSYTADNYAGISQHHMTALQSSAASARPTKPSVSQADLETELAYQEDTINALNQAVFRQQQSIDQLENICKKLVEKVGAMSRELNQKGGSAGSIDPRDEIPPHY